MPKQVSTMWKVGRTKDVNVLCDIDVPRIGKDCDNTAVVFEPRIECHLVLGLNNAM